MRKIVTVLLLSALLLLSLGACGSAAAPQEAPREQAEPAAEQEADARGRV